MDSKTLLFTLKLRKDYGRYLGRTHDPLLAKAIIALKHLEYLDIKFTTNRFDDVEFFSQDHLYDVINICSILCGKSNHAFTTLLQYLYLYYDEQEQLGNNT